MIDLDELRAELEEFAQPEKKGGRSASEERIIAGFEEIQRFFNQHKRVPQHGEDKDIFERLYAVRLDRLRTLEDCRALLAPLDHQGLLSGSEIAGSEPVESMNDDELMAELEGVAGSAEITDLDDLNEGLERIRQQLLQEPRLFELELYNSSREDEELFEALKMRVNDLELWFEEIVEMTALQKAALYYLVADCHRDINSALEKIDDLQLFEGDMNEAAIHLFDQLYLHEIPEHLQHYVNYDRFRENLRSGGELYEFSFAGKTYTCINAWNH